MPDFVFSNNVVDQLVGDISTGATALTVTNGAQFPSPDAPYEQFAILVRSPTEGTREIMYCTGRAGNVLTVSRAQEGTVATAFGSGAEITMPLTKGILEYLRDL